MLPSEIPESLRADAIPLDDQAECDAAWPRDQALAVLSSLDGSTVAVLLAHVYAPTPTGLLPTRDYSRCGPLPGESATEFARRSRAAARDFLEGRDDDPDALIAMSFSMQDDAA